MTTQDISTARSFAEQAAAAAAKFSPDTWGGIQALAQVSIAYSLLALAEREGQA